MCGQTAEESLMARRLVAALGLDHVAADAIAPEDALFGAGSPGLGLDSIDALEIALMIQQHYSVELRSDDPEVKAAFKSLRSLTEYVARRISAAGARG